MLLTGFEHSVRSSSFFHPLPETETTLCHHMAEKKKKAMSIQGHTVKEVTAKIDIETEIFTTDKRQLSG